jgi:hypothetical protein
MSTLNSDVASIAGRIYVRRKTIWQISRTKWTTTIAQLTVQYPDSLEYIVTGFCIAYNNQPLVYSTNINVQYSVHYSAKAYDIL